LRPVIRQRFLLALDFTLLVFGFTIKPTQKRARYSEPCPADYRG
jgi:hypothetical protein